MKIFLVWQENAVDGNSDVIGFCQTEEAACKMCDKIKAEHKSKSIRWYGYWIEEVEELV
jgi:hypothetical protein